MFCYCRVRSRSLCVKFSLPSTGPTTSEEFLAFDEFKSGMKEGKYTSAIGWVVGLRKIFLLEGKNYVQSKQQEIRSRVKTYTICRNTTGWASTLFFLEKVSSHKFPSYVVLMLEIPQFLTQVKESKLMEKVMEFVVGGANSSSRDEIVVPLCARSANEIVIESYRQLLTAANRLQLCEVGMYYVTEHAKIRLSLD